jgi:hypothetical protein
MKTNAFAIIALAALLSAPMGASAKERIEVDQLPKVDAGTVARQASQMKEMQGAAKALADGFPVISGKPNRLALEYRLGTHVEALARKYGQLDQAGKRCNIEGSYFEEDSLADVLGNAIPDSSVGIAKRAYAEGQVLDTPPCDQIHTFMNRLLEQVERHKKVIGSEGDQLMFMNAESRD